MKLAVTVGRSIDDVDVGPWSQVSGASYTAMSYSWLRAMEVLRPALRPLYARFDAEGTPYAVATAFMEPADTLVRKLLLRQTLLWTSARTPGMPIALREDVEPRDGLPRIARALAQVAMRHLRPTCTLVVPGLEYAPLLRAQGFHLFALPPYCAMDVNWSSYEEYTGSLKRLRRKKLRQRYQLAMRHGVQTEVIGAADADADRLWTLFEETCRENGDPACGGFRRDSFARLPGMLPWEQRVVIARHRGDVIGFLWTITDGRVLGVPFAGLRYALTRQTGAYPVLMAEVVRWCIERRIAHCNIGLTNHEMKRRIGFDVVPRHAAVRLSFSASEKLFSPLVPLLQRQFSHREPASPAAEAKS